MKYLLVIFWMSQPSQLVVTESQGQCEAVRKAIILAFHGTSWQEPSMTFCQRIEE